MKLQLLRKQVILDISETKLSWNDNFFCERTFLSSKNVSQNIINSALFWTKQNLMTVVKNETKLLVDENENENLEVQKHLPY